jgi:hypothetical protein
MNVKLYELCHYTAHDNGIHEFRLLVANRAAWDAYSQLVEDLVRASANEPVLRILMDLRSGTVPLAHAAKSYHDFNRRNPNRPAMRYAVLYGDNFLMSMADSVAKSVKPKIDELRLFHINRYDAAVEWLLID